MTKITQPFSGPALQIYGITVLFYSIVYMILMVLPFYALSVGSSKSDIGTIMGATMLASMAIRPIAGSIIDRHGPKVVLLCALFIFFLSLFGYFIPDPLMFGGLRIVQGMVAGIFSTAMEIVTINLMSDKLRGQGLSLYSLATIVPTTFGPALALYLKDWLPMAWVFGIFLVLGGCTFVFALALSGKLHAIAPRAAGNTPINRRGLWKNRPLLVFSGMMLLLSIANGAIFTFLPLYLEEKSLPYGSIYFLTQTVVLTGCRFVGRKWIPSNGDLPKGTIVFLSFLAAAGSFFLAFSNALPLLLVAAVCNGVAFALLYPNLLTFVSFAVPEHARAFLLALFIAAADLGFALGALAMGPLAEKFSFQLMFLVCSAFCLCACLLILVYKSGVRVMTPQHSL
jgi:MFS family permease